jgi:hypothetical protein
VHEGARFRLPMAQIRCRGTPQYPVPFNQPITWSVCSDALCFGA